MIKHAITEHPPHNNFLVGDGETFFNFLELDFPKEKICHNFIANFDDCRLQIIRTFRFCESAGFELVQVTTHLLNQRSGDSLSKRKS